MNAKSPSVLEHRRACKMMSLNQPITPKDNILWRFLQEMKGILIEPDKDPVVTTLPDTLQGMEHFCSVPARRKFCPAPCGAGVRYLWQEPEPYLSRPANLWHYPLLRLAK